MICIWGGVWNEWTDFEPFSAFIFHSASWIEIVNVVLSLLVNLKLKSN